MQRKKILLFSSVIIGLGVLSICLVSDIIKIKRNSDSTFTASIWGDGTETNPLLIENETLGLYRIENYEKVIIRNSKFISLYLANVSDISFESCEFIQNNTIFDANVSINNCIGDKLNFEESNVLINNSELEYCNFFNSDVIVMNSLGKETVIENSELLFERNTVDSLKNIDNIPCSGLSILDSNFYNNLELNHMENAIIDGNWFFNCSPGIALNYCDNNQISNNYFIECSDSIVSYNSINNVFSNYEYNNLFERIIDASIKEFNKSESIVFGWNVNMDLFNTANCEIYINSDLVNLCTFNGTIVYDYGVLEAPQNLTVEIRIFNQEEPKRYIRDIFTISRFNLAPKDIEIEKYWISPTSDITIDFSLIDNSTSIPYIYVYFNGSLIDEGYVTINETNYLYGFNFESLDTWSNLYLEISDGFDEFISTNIYVSKNEIGTYAIIPNMKSFSETIELEIISLAFPLNYSTYIDEVLFKSGVTNEKLTLNVSEISFTSLKKIELDFHILDSTIHQLLYAKNGYFGINDLPELDESFINSEFETDSDKFLLNFTVKDYFNTIYRNAKIYEDESLIRSIQYIDNEVNSILLNSYKNHSYNIVLSDGLGGEQTYFFNIIRTSNDSPIIVNEVIFHNSSVEYSLDGQGTVYFYEVYYQRSTLLGTFDLNGSEDISFNFTVDGWGLHKFELRNERGEILALNEIINEEKESSVLLSWSFWKYALATLLILVPTIIYLVNLKENPSDNTILNAITSSVVKIFKK